MLVKEIKEELKKLKVKGITGKKKAELMAMLEEAKKKLEPAPVRKLKLKKPAPAPAPEPPKMEEKKPVRIIKLKKKPVEAPAPVAPEPVDKETGILTYFYDKVREIKDGRLKVERKSDEAKHSHIHYNRTLQYVSFEWNEPNTTLANKDLTTRKSFIELDKNYKGVRFVVELLFTTPYKGPGDWETAILIFSPDYPKVYNKYTDSELLEISEKIIKHELDKKKPVEAPKVNEEDEKLNEILKKFTEEQRQDLYVDLIEWLNESDNMRKIGDEYIYVYEADPRIHKYGKSQLDKFYDKHPKTMLSQYLYKYVKNNSVPYEIYEIQNGKMVNTDTIKGIYQSKLDKLANLLKLD